ncbi:ATP-binding protein [Paenibacillus sp. BR2-3]|uniref:ATP-binding protein n=1 Tax=Paenibacillus sp. BR2-3 TaxID=3048494 RepID=UPI003977465D
MSILSQYDPRITEEFLQTAEEDQRFDRKRANIAFNDLATHIVGFANADGGVLVIGQTNSKELQGIDHVGQDKINALMKVSLTLCVPSVLVKTEEISIQNIKGGPDRLLLLHVEQSERLHTTTDDQIYYRKGDSTLHIVGETRRALEYDKGNRHYELEEIPDCSLDDLDDTIFQRYKELTGYSGTLINLLINRGLAVHKNGNLIMRVAGVLLLAKNPSTYLPQACIRFIRFEGMKAKTGTRANVVKEYMFEGPLVKQIERTKEVVQIQLRDFTALGQMGIFDTVPEYPEFAWVEAVVNAVTHRAYNLGGIEIMIRMYDDRLEFESPGKLPGMIRLHNIKDLRYSRNPRIAVMLSEFKYVRRWGEGIDRIYDEMQLFHLEPPELAETDQTFTLTLKNNIEVRRLRRESSVALSIGGERWLDLSPEQRQALELASIRKKVFTKDFGDFIGRSRVTAKLILESLVEEGYLERIGSKPTDPKLHYILKL